MTSNKNIHQLAAQDKEFVWHPFTPQHYAPENIIISSGKGAWFQAANGQRYLDGISSWWVNLHGHCNEYITEAVRRQLGVLEHSIFAAFTHEPGITLASRLLGHLPGFSKIFFSDNGSTAVEVGIKMAVQYWHNTGQPKNKVIAFRESYHGDTFGGMSVAARNAFNLPFEKLLFDVIHIDTPTADNLQRVINDLEGYLMGEDVACFIFEPLVLGAGGMKMYDAWMLDRLITLCNKHECLTIADEVMTGFGRTGTFFAIDQLAQKPDIICMSKGITGGYFPLGATACKAFIYDAFVSADKMKTFFHGHSYTGNPVTCSAALASLDLMETEETQTAIRRINHSHLAFAEKIHHKASICNVRVTGTILAFDVITKEATGYLNSSSDDIASWFLNKNVILRPLGNVVYVLPPYCITDNELQMIYKAISDFVEKR